MSRLRRTRKMNLSSEIALNTWFDCIFFALLLILENLFNMAIMKITSPTMVNSFISRINPRRDFATFKSVASNTSFKSLQSSHPSGLNLSGEGKGKGLDVPLSREPLYKEVSTSSSSSRRWNQVFTLCVPLFSPSVPVERSVLELLLPL